MPIVQIEMLEGRNLDQKREMVKGVTEVLVNTLKCPPEAVHIIIREMKLENVAENGSLFLDTKGS
jgi:4-oxalocrotonate tautomerase